MSENKLREALTAAHTALRAARAGNCDYQWFCDAIKTAEDALSQLTPTLQPQPVTDIDEAEISRMTERGAEAWRGVDAQALREGGQVAPQAGTDAWIRDVLASVAELPDRTSPDDQPDMMLVTADELRQILTNFAPASPVPQVGEVTDEQIDALIKKHARNLYSSSQLDWEVAEFHRFGLLQLIHAILALRPQSAIVGRTIGDGSGQAVIYDTTLPDSTPLYADALRPAAQPMTPEQTPNPFAKRCYAMSEPHLSGCRLIVGFTSSDDAAAAHTFVANIGRHNGITAQGAQTKE